MVKIREKYSFDKIRKYIFIVEYVYLAFMCMLIIRKYEPSGSDFGIYLPLLIDISVALLYSIIIYIYSGKEDEPTKIEVTMRIIYICMAGKIMMETNNPTVQIIILLPTVIMALRYTLKYTLIIALITTVVIIVNAKIYNYLEFDYLFVFVSFIWVLGLLVNTSMEIERQMQEERRKIQEKDNLAAIGQMAAGIAHEVRNPLTTIRGFVQLLGRYNEVAEKDVLKRYVHMIDSEIDRMNDLLNDILLYAKPKKPKLIKTNINRIIEEVKLLMEEHCDKKNIIMKMNMLKDIPDVKCDPKQIKQVILNITLNSIDAMEKCENKNIIWRTDYKNDYVIIEIKDNGCGMSQEQIKKIFNPFYTTKENGTGLGLSICKSIVEGHNGKLLVYSNVYNGTSFVITLPAIEAGFNIKRVV